MWMRRVTVRLRKAFKERCPSYEDACELFQADEAGFVHYRRVVDVIREYQSNLTDRQVQTAVPRRCFSISSTLI